ncbi:hypothetical protein [Streptococcus massiliensis]|uniref:Carbamoyl phosphate synthase large subunit n=1 Tax=Streptococcus massiliensis TaxID=313439 RepID=A0A380KVZ3_9STRE|nr:hypothetical protein [Streptococcus massiliensis]SUN75711.1 carbamoyl phosphate synthase large subunit [Streptococcus massiliensis]
MKAAQNQKILVLGSSDESSLGLLLEVCSALKNEGKQVCLLHRGNPILNLLPEEQFCLVEWTLENFQSVLKKVQPEAVLPTFTDSQEMHLLLALEKREDFRSTNIIGFSPQTLSKLNNQTLLAECQLKGDGHSFKYGKRITFQILRDSVGTTMIVASTEQMDPWNGQKEESFIFSPTQTLSDVEYQLLRDSSLKIARALHLVGLCTIDFILSPNSSDFSVHSLQLGLTKITALASQISTFPLPSLMAQLALGKKLTELINPVTQTSYASFEPVSDFIATQLLGEDRFALGFSWEESLLRFCQSSSLGVQSLEQLDDVSLMGKLSHSKNRPFYLLEALRRGYEVKELAELTRINLFFIDKLRGIVEMERAIMAKRVDKEILKKAKQMGFSDDRIAALWQMERKELTNFRQQAEIFLRYKGVDGCAGAYNSQPTLYYSSYFGENELAVEERQPLLIVTDRILTVTELPDVTKYKKVILVTDQVNPVLPSGIQADKIYLEPLTAEYLEALVAAENVATVWDGRKK